MESRRLTSGGLAAAVCVAVAGALLVAGAGSAQAVRRTATCNNTATDSATIQSVIDGSAEGDEIVIDGPCSITATITLKGDRSYRGDSRATVLKAAANRALPAVVASDSWMANWNFTGTPVTVRDLTIDGNRTQNGTTGDGLVIRSWQTTVENVTVLNAARSGIRIAGTARDGTTGLTNDQVNGTIRNVFVQLSGQDGIYVQDDGNRVTDWNLLDSWVDRSGRDGIRLDNAAGWTVERNHVYGNTAAGIDAHRLFGSCICDNYVEDFGTSGVEVTVQGDAASTVDGNRIFKFGGAGTTFLAVTQVNYGSGQIAVTGNTIRGGGTGTGLSYQAGNNQLTVTSTGNQVTGVTTPRTVGAGATLTTGL